MGILSSRKNSDESSFGFIRKDFLDSMMGKSICIESQWEIVKGRRGRTPQGNLQCLSRSPEGGRNSGCHVQGRDERARLEVGSCQLEVQG